tara:strand:+ start:172 stop:393 length:222 start_codon:yes stop_codon:yes gene_type:complete
MNNNPNLKRKNMTVEELIKKLQFIEDKSLPIRLETPKFGNDDTTNYWLKNIEEWPTGSSGYPNCGEVILNGDE